MTDKRQRSLLRTVAGMFVGMLPGLTLCMALGGYFKGVAEAETFLPMQDITVSGKVTAPGCTARLENDWLRFDKKKSDLKAQAAQKQTLRLNLSQCEVEGVGVMFRAESWPDYPARGSLKDKKTQQHSDAWYYTVAVETDDNAETAWPLLLSADSPELETNEHHQTDSNNSNGHYFSLNKVTYWYDVKEPLKENDVLIIPFSVEVHHDMTREDTREQDELDANFTLQLSYR
ncbi:hypothetical protein ACSOQX_003020 [Yersinia enterocolitica]|nr:hypothetical protein [Yersinia enterocolitica]EKN5104600.1 hypothetical protein [Yersinia enterocolitica]